MLIPSEVAGTDVPASTVPFWIAHLKLGSLSHTAPEYMSKVWLDVVLVASPNNVVLLGNHGDQPCVFACRCIVLKLQRRLRIGAPGDLSLVEDTSNAGIKQWPRLTLRPKRVRSTTTD